MVMIAVASFLILPLDTWAAASEDSTISRPQSFAYSEEAVADRAAVIYSSLINELRRKGTLDDDAPLYSRVQRIAGGLITQAVAKKPAARNWHWEVHTTSDANEEATSSAGGKLLFGTAYIKALDLDDGELAALMAHEIAHAIAEHQREEVSQVFFLNSTSIPITVDTAMTRLDNNLSLQIQLSPLLQIQEAEADQLGMIIAHDAGWPARSILSFYQKLAAADSPTILSVTYPPPRSRVAMAENFARAHP